MKYVLSGWKSILWTGMAVGGLIFAAYTLENSSTHTNNSLKANKISKKDTAEQITRDIPVEEQYTVSNHTGKVRYNDSFYRIFNRLGVSARRIYELTSMYGDLLDDFEMKPGQHYHYQLINKDSVKILKEFIWEPNRRDYLLFKFRDTLTVTKHRKEQTKKIVSAAGIIESSLYETFMDQQLPIQLAYKLSELYAWGIDFFRLREGDRFKVIYEQLYVEGKQVGIGNILASEFKHRGRSHKAYRFYNGTEMGYYDLEGESLQKALLKAPLKFRYISSGFSHDRYHPILHRRMPHYGIDYVAPRGTPVVSVGDGTVLIARYKGVNGNMVKIRHNSTYTTTYIHLSRFADGIRRGTKVKQGEVIGFVGSTGRSTGSHLDYRLYKNGSPVNPRAINLPPTDGIDEKYLKAFHYARQQYDLLLNEIDTSKNGLSRTAKRPAVSSSDEDDVGKSS